MNHRLRRGAILFASTGSLLAVQPQHAFAQESLELYDWSGPSIGINLGLGVNHSDLKTNLEPGGRAAWLASRNTATREDSTATLLGGSLGYDWQSGHFVFGVLGDLTFGGFRGRTTDSYLNPYGIEDTVGRNFISYDSEWYGTLRSRFGYADDNLLVYGTLGYAFGHLETLYKFEVTQGEDTIAGDFDAGLAGGGWTAGGGVEYGFKNWSLGLEYLYVDLGQMNFRGNFSGEFDPDFVKSTRIRDSASYTFSVVQASAKFRF